MSPPISPSNLNNLLTLAQSLISVPKLALLSNAQTVFSEQQLTATDFTVSDTLISLGSLNTAPLDQVSVQISNTGTNPLPGFAIQVKFAAAGDWITLFDQAADFTTPNFGSPLQNASGNLTALAAGAKGSFTLDVTFFSEVQFLALSDANTTVTVFAGLKSRVKYNAD